MTFTLRYDLVGVSLNSSELVYECYFIILSVVTRNEASLKIVSASAGRSDRSTLLPSAWDNSYLDSATPDN